QTQIITRLKQALDTNQLELYFQSQNDANTNEIVGLEALLRWKSEGEMIPPDVFIPLAEQTTLIRILEQLKELGFHISMDDFGTGYSSLSYLKNLPIDKLKIDKSFITDIAKEPKNQIIVKTIIFLAKELKFHILAEGVETQEELDFLINNKIDSIQGYYYTKPLPEMQMQELLQA
ncbi:MAG: EAL domain-containing protein, partial [Sulfurimonas sp.]|nr:EAL domain-containing protein [Sulfurimonas sp.]